VEKRILSLASKKRSAIRNIVSDPTCTHLRHVKRHAVRVLHASLEGKRELQTLWRGCTKTRFTEVKSGGGGGFTEAM